MDSMVQEAPGLAMRESVELLTDLTDIHHSLAVRESRVQDEAYEAGLAHAAEIYAEGVSGGSRGLRNFREALSDSEFTSYFGDVIDRAVYARFQAWVPPFERFVKVGTFNDLTRNKRRTQWRGGNQTLGRVGEFGPYPVRGTTPLDFEWQGYKYGADFAISWEAMLADDLNGLRDLPDVLASAARSTEAFQATSLYVDANGPHASLYTTGQGNKGTAALSIDAIAAGVTAMAGLTDPESGVPLFNRPKYLVVPPALEIDARGILESMTVAYAATASSAVPLPTANIVGKLGLELIVDPWIPLIATTGTVGDTSWFLFSEPNAGPLGPGLAAVEFDRLRGMDRPLLLRKRGQYESVAGGPDPRGQLSDLDISSWRVVHPMGGSRLFWQATYGSTGAS